MKKLFKGAVPTIALLLVAVMSLTSLTYAWFTAGDTATVDTVDVSVKDVEGLLISPNGINGTWGSTMKPLFHLDANGTTNPANSGAILTLRDVSTVGTVGSDGKIKFFSAEYDNKYDALVSATALPALEFTDTQVNKTYANWIAFDVYLKNDSASAFTINLDGSKIDATAMTRAVARVAVVKQGTANSKTVLADNTKPTITGTPTLVKIWEPNAGTHTANGQSWITNNGISGTTVGGINVIPYYGVAKAFDKVTGKYYNRAEDGTVYSIVNNLGAALDPDSFAADTYYVYTELADHFRAITIDDFYKIADQQKVAAAVSATAGTAGTATTYYKRTAANTYVNLKIGDTLTQGESYYEKITGIGTSASPVEVYTKANNDGNLASVSGNLVYVPSGIEIELGAEKITKLTVYVWFEGQDCDCNNDVANNNFQMNLQFKKKPTT